MKTATHHLPQRTLPWIDNIAYSMGNLGSNLIFGMASFYMMYFYTDVMGITAATVGILLLVARLWDAINDPIMGTIVDKTHTRWGQFRPFIIAGLIPCAVLYVLTFYTPDLSTTGKVIWAFATYIPLGMVITSINIPYHAQTTIMSKDSAERAEIGTVTNITMIIGMLIVAVFTLPLVNSFSTPQEGFVYTTAIFGGAMIICYFITFVRTKKYDLPTSTEDLKKTAANNFTFKEKTRVLTQNRPLMALMIAYLFFQTGTTVMTTTAVYFFKYWLRLESVYPAFMGLYLICSAVGMAFVPLLVRKIGKKNLFQVSNIATAAVLLITFISCLVLGREAATESFNLGILFGVCMLGAVFNGPVIALVWGMLPDTVEYAEWKVGIRSEGLIFALLSFVMKAGLALGGAICGAVFAYREYVPNQEQTERVLFGMLLLFIVYPFISRIGTGIAMTFYDLDEARFAKIVKELQMD